MHRAHLSRLPPPIRLGHRANFAPSRPPRTRWRPSGPYSGTQRLARGPNKTPAFVCASQPYLCGQCATFGLVPGGEFTSPSILTPGIKPHPAGVRNEILTRSFSTGSIRQDSLSQARQRSAAFRLQKLREAERLPKSADLCSLKAALLSSRENQRQEIASVTTVQPVTGQSRRG